MKGRKPKPVEQRIREGNPGKRRLPDTIMVAGRPVPGELADPPAELGPDAARWWVENVPLMAESGLLDRIDRANLTIAAHAWGDYVKVRRVLAVDGFFTTGSRGQIRPHPAMKLVQDREERFLKMSEAFGWNPSARTRLGLQQLEGMAKLRDLDSTLDTPADDGEAWGGDVVDVGLPGA